MKQHAACSGNSGTSCDEVKNLNHLSLMKWKMPFSAITALPCFMLLTLFSAAGFAQSSATVLSNRISKTWKMEKMVQGNKISATDASMGDFVLIIHADHTVEQGMYPDGLIKGTWSVDEQKRILSIKDTETAIEYNMKIVSVSANELILEDQSSTGGLTIYYKAK